MSYDERLLKADHIEQDDIVCDPDGIPIGVGPSVKVPIRALNTTPELVDLEEQLHDDADDVARDASASATFWASQRR